MSESARSILKHLYEEGRMTEYQYQKIDRNLKEPKHGEWIPCSERLPEEVKSVLVTGKNTHCVYTSFMVCGEWEYGGDVIAWMPLPEPYEGSH